MKRAHSEIDSSSEEEQPQFQASKKMVLSTPNPEVASNFETYNSVSRNMMQLMGHQIGTGLGRYGQGRVNIVEASKQRGRRGLGLQLTGLETSSDVQWQSEEENVSVEEEVFWMPECHEEPPAFSELKKMTLEGPKKMNIDDEIQFCSELYLSNVLAGKKIFDNLEPEELRKARTRSNPFETIRGVIFQNRAAVKMANMDYVFDFMFTDPVDSFGNSLVAANGLLYFADICAGPGGFSEYVLWKKAWDSKGFGFTLKGQNDFKLHEFFAGPAEMFEPHYGINGVDGDGDVFVPGNADEFKKFVLESTDHKGVHFVMADGGFSVEGQENIQEILSKRLYLCQFMFALSILRTDGHFVCKLFDVFTSFSVGLIYLLYRSFKKVCIHKPNTSRPANSERYIICKWRREGTKDVARYLYEVNLRLDELEKNHGSQDVLEIIPLDLLKQDEKFYQYMVDSNERLARQQIINLAKIKAFAQNRDLHEEQQSELRRKCLAAWKIPDHVRSAPKRPNPNVTYAELIKEADLSYLTHKPKAMANEVLASVESIYEYRCMVCCSGTEVTEDKGFLFGLGRSNVMVGDGTNESMWKKLDLRLELPKNTIVYAEIVNELQGEGRAQRKVKAVHIIDALFLGGKDVRNLDFVERLAQAEKLVKAVSKPSHREYSPIRVKELYEFKDLDLVFERLDMRCVKSGRMTPRLCYTLSENRHLLPAGIYFVKIVKKPWVIAWSRSRRQIYYFNTRTNQSSFDFPDDAAADFKTCFTERIFWAWEPGVKIFDHHQADDQKVHKSTICNFIEKRSS